jgi:GTPase SAR1 family protein
MRTGDGFICVYAVTLEQTFEAVKRFREHIVRVKDTDAKNVPFVIAGNKSDLEDQRVISKEKGEALGAEMNVKHFETSAKTKLNVAEIFTQVAREIVALREKAAPEEANKLKGGKSGRSCVLL